MDIVQKDIFDKNHKLDVNQKPAREAAATSAAKFFPKVGFEAGVNEKQIQADFVVIHRIIQNRLAKDLDKNFVLLLKIFLNEARIKAGRRDAVTATRDSLLAYLCKSV